MYIKDNKVDGDINADALANWLRVSAAAQAEIQYANNIVASAQADLDAAWNELINNMRAPFDVAPKTIIDAVYAQRVNEFNTGS